MDLVEKIKALPSCPGVYLMKDSHGGILYVGKSKKLKSRVSSYFQHSKNQPSKIARLVKNIRDIDYIQTDTEFEALMLECKLIKEIKPIYNRQMKNPRNYAYIHISPGNGINRISITTEKTNVDGPLYFGPYKSKSSVENTLEGLKEFYKILCNNPASKGQPCLNYSLGICIGICKGEAVEYYHKTINKIISLLNGSNMTILKELEEAMLDAASNENYTAAAKYRDLNAAVSSLVKREEVLNFTEAGQFIVAIEALNDSVNKIFLINRTEVLFSEKIDNSSEAVYNPKLISQLWEQVMLSYQTKVGQPKREIENREIDEAQIIYNYLKNSKCRYLVIPETLLKSPNPIQNLDQALTNFISL